MLVRQSDVLTREADRLITGKKDYHNGISNLAFAEKLLQRANGHHPKLAELSKALAAAYKGYAKGCLDRASTLLKQGKLKDAEFNALSAMEFDKSLKPQARAILEKIKAQKGRTGR